MRFASLSLAISSRNFLTCSCIDCGIAKRGKGQCRFSPQTMASQFPKSFLKIFDGFLGLPDFVPELVRIEVDRGMTSGTSVMRIAIEPSDRFLGFLAALRAGNGDGLVIEKGHHKRPFQVNVPKC
ncbi:MAG: hypothetical protein ACRD23_05460 [Terriglobales bacterium]